MRFKQKLKTNIITVDTEYATLESLDNSIYRYLVVFFVNPQLAMIDGVSNVTIYISKDPNLQTNIPIFNTATSAVVGAGSIPLLPSQTVSQLLQRNSVIKDVARSAEQNTLLTVRTDITSKIPNDAAQQLARRDTTNPIVLNRIRQFQSVPVESLSAQNINVPILERSMGVAPSPTNTDEVDVGNLRTIANDLLVNRNVDPASLLIRENALVNSRVSFGGIDQKVSRSRVLGTMHAPILSSLHPSGVQKPTFDILPPNAIINIPAVADVTNVLMQEYIDIPYGSINENDFYLIFILKNRNGIPIQRLVKSVGHSKNIAALLTPRNPPIINVFPVGKIGKNTLEIKQTDTNALGVSLYRKIVNKSSHQINAEYTFAGKIPLTLSDGFKLIDDLVNNGNPIIYRAIPYGQHDKLGAEFGSSMAKGVPFPIKSGKYHRKPSFATMTYEFTDSGIIIDIKNISSGACSIILFKQDLTSKQDFFYVDVPKLLTGKGSESVTFKDSSVSKGRIYNYFYKLVYKDGQEEYGANTLTIEYTPETSNVVNTIIINPKVVEQGTDLDIQFTIQSSLVKTAEDDIQNSLKKQGLSEFFNQSVNKENLQNLIGYGIVRVNLVTGEVEDFGIITETNFSDIKFGPIKGVKPVESGYEYEYIIYTYFRSPITLLENYVKDVTFSNTPALDYSFKPFDWLQPVTLTQGNIVTTRSLGRNHSKSQFQFGEVGKITKVVLSVANILPSIYSISAAKVNSKLIKIQWKIQGTVTRIDHFIVMIEILGMRSVIGKCHNISDSNYFEFFDELDNGDKGALSYIIIPVYFDYSRGKEAQTNKVLI